MPYAALDVEPNQLLQTHGSLNFDDRDQGRQNAECKNVSKSKTYTGP